MKPRDRIGVLLLVLGAAVLGALILPRVLPGIF
jgi:hypothetical protein